MVTMVDSTLTTAPCLPSPRPQWIPPSQPSRVAIRASFKPAALRVSCCSGATTSSATTSDGVASLRGEEVGSRSSAPFGEVYVASVPLRAPRGAAEVLEVMQHVELFENFQHFMTIIKPNDDGGAPCTVLDFQPQDPENPMTVVNVVMGNSIPGVILERTLSRLPNQRCWWVGDMKPGLSLEDALEFSRTYDSELSLGVNDCRHHTLDLVEYLTGKRMNFIEEVRNVREREQWLAEEAEFEKRLLEASGKESPDSETAEEEPAEEATVENVV
ncbi:hypothetical protein KC19_7G127500 [Ceratodon purpureus]|uniref:Uncharacterized protein n=1 Tax=Ceratodon purpureus TaxID=3225 RepID=A0A8T0HAY6_CERPU|nr:hypothetical protein KC19_7G127500 [Ceratodon purpureus]